jgi:hypothetical protein
MKYIHTLKRHNTAFLVPKNSYCVVGILLHADPLTTTMTVSRNEGGKKVMFSVMSCLRRAKTEMYTKYT